ncbi:MAG: plastocyanin/azurin family copper-binding protein [Myxococcota bacterium]
MKRLAPFAVLALFGCTDEWLVGQVYSVSMNPKYADEITQVPEPYRPSVEESAEAIEESSARSAPVEVKGGVATVRFAVSNGLAYPYDEIRIPAGTKTIELTLAHEGNVPVTAMGHNMVFLKAGADGEAFALSSSTARDNGYISTDMGDSVIANTKMLGGGDTDTIKFDVPAAGEYPFLCSFPGHYALMNGKLIVEG